MLNVEISAQSREKTRCLIIGAEIGSGKIDDIILVEQNNAVNSIQVTDKHRGRSRGVEHAGVF